MNTSELSVTLLTRFIQETLGEVFHNVRVIGEISNFKHHSSGHRYFTLKDQNAQIRCVFWNKRRAPNVLPCDGMQVVVTGKVTVFAPQGNYQIDCFSIEPAGVGELYLAFERLKNELTELGYFDTSRKKEIPTFPVNIGIATSPTGAVVQDITRTLAERMPAARIYFRPTQVQGNGAAEDIVQAITDLHRYPCDVLIVGRGGGSLEDLWPFNTRAVADAIYNARIPIISAVGHETDFTIADFVADLRASTPTGAAVACSPYSQHDLMMEIDHIADSMESSVRSVVESLLYTATSWADGSVARELQQRLSARSEKLSTVATSMQREARWTLKNNAQLLAHAESLLRSLRPLAPLERGFALVYKNGNIVRNDDTLEPGDVVSVQRHNKRNSLRVID